MKRELVVKTFKNPPVLRTDRLILRKLTRADTCDMYEYAHLPEVVRYLTWDIHPSEAYTARYLQYLNGRYRAGEFYDWAVIFAEERKMIGTCGFTSFDFNNDSAEVGYVLNPDYWGMGIATEAVARVLRFGFAELMLHRIEAKYMPPNTASRRVMEKNGMSFEGICREGMLVKGNYIDYGVCAITSGDYFGKIR